ncbi:MAG TPA: hypothetical protein VK212_00105 [Lentimicrobium sp.]|nr:hypothetical protein [Lentimicrobium sp.]
MTWKEIIIYLTIPSFIFFYLPFSESLFFLSSVFLIIGIKNNRIGLILTGLFIASLSRPAFLIFIPALFIIEFLTGQKKQNQTLSNKIVRFILYLIIMGTGTLVVAFIQFRDTHEWFRFLEVQKGWGNYLQIPNLPLTSWAGGYIVRLDGSAFLSGMITGFFLLLYLIRARFTKNVTLSKEVIFSLAYLGGITLSVLLFRGGSLFSLNRFVFSTAFIVVTLHYLYSSDLKLSLRQLLLIFITLTFFWILFFKSYSHIQYFLKFTFLTLYLILPFTLKSEIKLYRQIGFVLLLALNIFFQISFYLRFLDGGWIG